MGYLVVEFYPELIKIFVYSFLSFRALLIEE